MPLVVAVNRQVQPAAQERIRTSTISRSAPHFNLTTAVLKPQAGDRGGGFCESSNPSPTLAPGRHSPCRVLPARRAVRVRLRRVVAAAPLARPLAKRRAVLRHRLEEAHVVLVRLARSRPEGGRTATGSRCVKRFERERGVHRATAADVPTHGRRCTRRAGAGTAVHRQSHPAGPAGQTGARSRTSMW